ncbi:LuxR C-terminal-related transcriptional regulator [Gordonia alkaliphila]|uniref:LuxR C-terminal-related transcriptional regulator n=1 Tax=Gordonia alkaliphila TaxID=1053547 RepID=UPI0031E8DB92
MSDERVEQRVGVWASSPWQREMLTAWVLGAGYRAVVVDLLDPVTDLPPVILACGGDRALDAELSWSTASRVLVIGGDESAAVLSGFRHLPDADGAADLVSALLIATLGAPTGRVQISRREREVLTTYVLGATVDETADEHFVAASTVRTHYRRATQRYSAAGRPVLNKTQLLLQMIADGWIEVNGGTGASTPVGTARGRVHRKRVTASDGGLRRRSPLAAGLPLDARVP